VSATAPYEPEQIEAARVLFARPVEFLMGAVSMDALPPTDLPEIAFAGRSNVGKSSLINALVNRHRLARTSADPGRTREINFFLLDTRLRLTDLPGYGFAKVSRSTARQFQDLGRAYLRGRPNLRRVYLLIDGRHGLKAPDTEALDALDMAAVSYQIVLTKADKLKRGEAEAVMAATVAKVAKRAAAFPRVIATSAETGEGLPLLRAEIAAAAFA
jgi:GTP-binding protein